MRSHRAVLGVVCLGLATVVSAVSALNVAIPSIARDVDATQTELSWIIDSYALTFAALLLPLGALGDRVGRRRMLLAGLTVFGASAGCAMLTSSPEVLIALRSVLGAGAAGSPTAGRDVQRAWGGPALRSAAPGTVPRRASSQRRRPVSISLPHISDSSPSFATAGSWRASESV